MLKNHCRCSVPWMIYWNLVPRFQSQSSWTFSSIQPSVPNTCNNLREFSNKLTACKYLAPQPLPRNTNLDTTYLLKINKWPVFIKMYLWTLGFCKGSKAWIGSNEVRFELEYLSLWEFSMVVTFLRSDLESDISFIVKLCPHVCI